VGSILAKLKVQKKIQIKSSGDQDTFHAVRAKVSGTGVWSLEFLLTFEIWVLGFVRRGAAPCVKFIKLA
jgi:hypothetical protein